MNDHKDKCGQCNQDVKSGEHVYIKYPTWLQKELHYKMQERLVCKPCLPRLKMACDKLLAELKAVGCG